MPMFSTSPLAMIKSVFRHRELIYASSKREVIGRYRGSSLGVVWSLLIPLLMLATYTFVFSEVFRARWPGGNESKSEFALVLFAGLIVFNLFAECFNRAPNLILSNPNYVKKVVYPLETMPVVLLLSGLYHAFVSTAVWILAYFLLVGIPHFTIVYLPLIFLPISLLLLGLTWGLASLGVYLRDVTQVVGVLTTVLMFLSPIFYPATALPESYRSIFYFNPLTPAIELTRDVLMWGRPPNFLLLSCYCAGAAFLAWLGFFWFQKTRKGFADVL